MSARRQRWLDNSSVPTQELCSVAASSRGSFQGLSSAYQAPNSAHHCDHCDLVSE